MTVIFSARSNRGRLRENNEDNLFADGEILPDGLNGREFSFDAAAGTPLILAVCDGMGGEEAGEFASETAVKTLSEFQDKLKKAADSELYGIVENYVQTVNARIASSGKRSGTTLALAVAAENGISCFNIGDSRIYCMKRNTLTRVTNDHTKGEENVKKGIISAEQSRRSRDGHKLTRCIGIGSCREAESYPVIRGKCRILICSDGLSDMLSDDSIGGILRRGKNTAEAADELVRAALDNGGTDNITFILAEVPFSKFIKWRRIR